MFPSTYIINGIVSTHVKTVVLMSRKENNGQKVTYFAVIKRVIMERKQTENKSHAGQADQYLKNKSNLLPRQMM